MRALMHVCGISKHDQRMTECAHGSPVSSDPQTSPCKHLATRGVLARLGMARSCALRMKGAGFGQGVTGLAGVRGDTGRMAHPSGAAMEASLEGRKGETKSLWRQCGQWLLA